MTKSEQEIEETIRTLLDSQKLAALSTQRDGKRPGEGDYLAGRVKGF